MKKTGDYYVVVVEDTNLGQIVATATLITEHKFIHSCAKVCVFLHVTGVSCCIWVDRWAWMRTRPVGVCLQRGRVEEVVVSDVCRGKQLGKLWVQLWLVWQFCYLRPLSMSCLDGKKYIYFLLRVRKLLHSILVANYKQLPPLLVDALLQIIIVPSLEQVRTTAQILLSWPLLPFVCVVPVKKISTAF